MVRLDFSLFTRVPDYVIDIFFGESSYINRMQVVCFALVNGIGVDHLLSVIRWRDINNIAVQRKVRGVYRWLSDVNNPRRSEYYAFSVITNQVEFLNGDVRYYGRRTYAQNVSFTFS